jgi:hypothetical protein
MWPRRLFSRAPSRALQEVIRVFDHFAAGDLGEGLRHGFLDRHPAGIVSQSRECVFDYLGFSLVVTGGNLPFDEVTQVGWQLSQHGWLDSVSAVAVSKD